jgi:leucyl aminopeptidase (aminopeptidase T)
MGIYIKAYRAAQNALSNVLEAKAGEKIIIICDDKLKEIGSAFAHGASDFGLWTRLVVLETKKIRKDIPKHLTEILSSQKPDIFINLLRGKAEETPFRIKVIKMERRTRTRLGHCPGITLDMMEEGALALSDSQYQKMQGSANRLMYKLQDAETIEISSPSGTELSLSVKNRDFFTDTQLNWATMKWMNLPVGEVIVGPIESSLSGTLVCDSAIGGIGLLKKSLIIEAEKGKAQKIQSKDKIVLKRVKSAFNTDSWSNTIGEFAFGINPSARVCNEFLETEKIKGTCHIAFGNNTEFPGGKNPSLNHMDFLIAKPTVDVIWESGKKLRAVTSGKLNI